MYLDVVDACNLACQTCPRGAVLKNTPHTMDFSLFKRTIDKAKSEGIEHVSLFNWSEPFLHKELANFVAYAKESNLFCSLSSNLSLPKIDHLIPTLRHNPDDLVVTVSGFTQDIYSINHVQGNLKNVFNNLEKIAKAHSEKPFETKIIVRYLVFDYNQHQLQDFKNYVQSLGLTFQEAPGKGDPKAGKNFSTPEEFDRECATYILEKYPLLIANRTKNQKKLCTISSSYLALDAHANCYVCCVYPYTNFFKIGNYLDLDKDSLFFLQNTHPFCLVCEWQKRDISHEEAEILARFYPYEQIRSRKRKSTLGKLLAFIQRSQ